MRNELCPHENAVLQACRSNTWNDDLLKHFRECSVCQEAEWSAEWMRNAVHQEPTPLPDPSVMWIRARIAAGEREASRAVWLSAFRKTLLYGSLSAAGTWLALDLLRTEGIDPGQHLQALTTSFGVVPLGVAVFAAAVYFTPYLMTRIRNFNPF